MPTIIFAIVTVIAVYVACRKPVWFWTVLVAGPALLEILGRIFNFDTYNLPAGPILLRATDAGLFATLIGIAYNLRRKGWKIRVPGPMRLVLASLFVFMFLKLLYSVLLHSDEIMLNRSVSHAAGGLVAALGDLRDGLLPFFAVYYAYLVPDSRDLDTLGWPIVAAALSILVKAAIGIGLGGSVWSGTETVEPPRFIISYDAANLTMFGFILFFIHVPGIKQTYIRTLALLCVVIATIANHRSQWLSLCVGIVILVPLLLFGRPLLSHARLARVWVSGVALVILSALLFAFSFPSSVQGLPVLQDVSVRLYAFTDPKRDPDSVWRETIWKDRIEQVGDSWAIGRPLGDRNESLVKGRWINLPDHSAYVTIYELGGLIFGVLIFFFWGRLTQMCIFDLMRESDAENRWPAAVGLAVIGAAIAFGFAYYFPYLGPSLALILALGNITARQKAGLHRGVTLTHQSSPMMERLGVPVTASRYLGPADGVA